MQSKDITDRLQKIENNLSQIKIILLVVSPLILFGLFGPHRWISRLGSAIFGLAVIFCIIYLFLTVMEKVTEKERIEREQQMENDLMREVEQQNDK